MIYRRFEVPNFGSSDGHIRHLSALVYQPPRILAWWGIWREQNIKISNYLVPKERGFLKLFLHVSACNVHWEGILLRYAWYLPGSCEVFIANRDSSKVLEQFKWWLPACRALQYTCRQVSVFSMDLVLLVLENACDHTTSWLISLGQKALT